MTNLVRHRRCGVARGHMSDVAKTLNDLARLCGKSGYQLAQYSGRDPTFVRRLFDGEKRGLKTMALEMDPALARNHPA